MRTLKGKTALVTGASSGIGEAVARRLAQEGANVVLVARSEAKLRALADTLSEDHGINAVVVVADLIKPSTGEAVRRHVDAQGIAIDVLVNNAGFGTYGPFEDIEPGREQDEVAVNVAALVGLTHAFLPPMLQRGHGAILNVASTSAFQPGPYMAVYAATKAFVLSFSEALWAEYRDRGVHVVALCPGAVETPFFAALGDDRARQASALSRMARAEDVAESAMRALRGNGPTRIVGGRNWLMAQSVRFAPRGVVARIGAGMLRPPTLT
jgi:short-subunit dehydrogenase